MNGEARKAAVAAYKERKVVGGVYAVRCDASSEVCIGCWVDIATIKNRMWFELRQDTHPNRDLIAAWRRHGESQFSFEMLERLEDESSPYIRAAKLGERASHCRKNLQASAV